MNKTPCPHCGQIHGTACNPPPETIVYPDVESLQTRIKELEGYVELSVEFLRKIRKGFKPEDFEEVERLFNLLRGE